MWPLEWLSSVSPVSVLGMGFLAAGLGVAVGFLHRAYTGSRVPFFAPVIVGLGAVGLWINSASALILFVSSLGPEATGEPVVGNVGTNVATAVVAGVAAYGGGRAGDHLAPNLRALTGAQEVDRGVNRLVRTIGRVITVSIPERIEDIDGYEPVAPETKSKLAGVELVFPRGLTVEQLRDRISTRLREDYGVGHVDVEVDADGEIQYLGVGSRAAGLGPTLPPRRVGIAVTTNPPPKASPGDRVQLWELAEAEPAADAERTADDPPAGAPEPSAGAEGRNEHSTEGDGTVAASTAGRDGTGEDLPAALVAHPDRWYRPDSETYAFAIRTPDGGRRYRKTAAAAATLVELYYGPAEGDAPDATRGPSAETGSDATGGAAPASDGAATGDGPGGDAAEPPAPEPRRVATAELRATSGDVATLAVDVGQIDDIDQSRNYRVATLRGEKNPEREFAALLRTADETMESVRVEPESLLDGTPVGAIRPSVVGVHPREGSLETLPAERRRCAAGDTLYVVGRHDELRKVATAAGG